MAVNFISGGNRRTRRKPPTCLKSLTNFVYREFIFGSFNLVIYTIILLLPVIRCLNVISFDITDSLKLFTSQLSPPCCVIRHIVWYGLPPLTPFLRRHIGRLNRSRTLANYELHFIRSPAAPWIWRLLNTFLWRHTLFGQWIIFKNPELILLFLRIYET